MTLLNLTTRYYLMFFLIVLTIGSVIFYFAIKHEVYVNADEALFNRKNAIVNTFKEKKGPLNPEIFDFSDFKLREISKTQFDTLKDHYADTIIYEPTDNEWDDYRRLITAFTYEGKFHQLTIVKPQLENDEILAAMAIGLGSLSGLLILALVFGTRWLSQKLWKPFENTLQTLNDYRLDKKDQLNLPGERINEFDRLNSTLNRMAKKNYEVYRQQKKFIENASHEIQTPLAVIRSKLELLIQQTELSQKSAGHIEAISDATDRLSKLNRTLLLLVKIENQQFIEEETIVLYPFIESILEQLSDQYEIKNVRISQSLNTSAMLKANRTLMEILFSNLIRNAFAHNVQDGYIDVKLTPHSFTIANSGQPLQVAPASLFNRFTKNNAHPQHIGLGLALVKQICGTYGYQISYEYADLRHKIILQF